MCGGPFAVEVLLGRNVKTFTVAFIEGELYAHDHCEGTIREAFDAAKRKPEGMEQAIAVRDALPDESPIGKAVTKWIDNHE